jgi:hypothetical protein
MAGPFFPLLFPNPGSHPVHLSKDGYLGLRERPAQDWDSRYGDRSMVCDRIYGVGPGFRRADGKGRRGGCRAELAGCPAGSGAANTGTK